MKITDLYNFLWGFADEKDTNEAESKVHSPQEKEHGGHTGQQAGIHVILVCCVAVGLKLALKGNVHFAFQHFKIFQTAFNDRLQNVSACINRYYAQ